LYVNIENYLGSYPINFKSRNLKSIEVGDFVSEKRSIIANTFGGWNVTNSTISICIYNVLFKRMRKINLSVIFKDFTEFYFYFDCNEKRMKLKSYQFKQFDK
jgi:hypothetical protein